MAGVQATYGNFAYSELSGGNVLIQGSWAHDNLVVEHNVCGTGLSIQLHKKVVPIFELCLREAMQRCPTYKVRMLGGHCARHQMHLASNPLSVHSWGAAVDLNWDKNPVTTKAQGCITDLPAAFVAAFTEQGWVWGGSPTFSRVSFDSMHFQFATGV